MQSTETKERRRSRRVPIPNVQVEIHSPDLPQHAGWAASAIDINGDGMALVLPQELPEGSALALTFSPDGETTFEQVPCVVQRQDRGYGAVRFAEWDDDSLLALLGFLSNDATIN